MEQPARHCVVPLPALPSPRRRSARAPCWDISSRIHPRRFSSRISLNRAPSTRKNSADVLFPLVFPLFSCPCPGLVPLRFLVTTADPFDDRGQFNSVSCRPMRSRRFPSARSSILRRTRKGINVLYGWRPAELTRLYAMLLAHVADVLAVHAPVDFALVETWWIVGSKIGNDRSQLQMRNVR